MNPFWSDADDELRGRHVRVVANDGTRYTGWVQRISHNQRHVLLRDATRMDDGSAVAELGTTFVAHVDAIEADDEPASHIERVDLDDISDSPYAMREFDPLANGGYISQVQDEGWVGSYPTVRRVDDGFEILEGHKRIWVARQACLGSHPVEIVDVSAWDAARLFVHDHFPDRQQVDGEETIANGYYDATQIRHATEELVDRWGERAFDLPRVDWNADRLGLNKTGGQRVTDIDSEDFLRTLDTPLSAVEKVADEAVTATTYDPPSNGRQWDHTDPNDLRDAYDDADTLTEAAEPFDVTYATVRKRLIEYGIHEPDTYGSDDDDDDGEEDDDEDDEDYQVGDHLDEADIEDDTDEGDTEEQLPDGVEQADIEAALPDGDKKRNIEDVAEDLGLSVKKTRAALSGSGHYERVREGARMRGGYR